MALSRTLPVTSLSSSSSSSSPPVSKTKFSTDLLEKIQTNQWTINTLDLSDQKLTYQDIVALAEVLKCNEYINSLKVANCSLKVASVCKLVQITRLASLDASNNALEDKDIRALTIKLAENASL